MSNDLRSLILFGLLLPGLPTRAQPASPPKPDDQFIELEKTANIVELALEFEGCPAGMTFRVQDGAMSTLAMEGREPVRFIIKMRSPRDIQIHLVEPKVFSTPNGPTRGLWIRDGVSLHPSVGAAELSRAGLRAVRLLSVTPSTAAAAPTGQAAVSPMQPPGGGGGGGGSRCCTFTACNGLNGQFCTTGTSGCGGDGCGWCCI